jgi:hypothetical protein
MRKILSKKASAWALAGTASLVAAVAATAAIADSEDPVPTISAAERADTYLQTTQKELSSTGISVSSIALAATRDGVDYYALRGDKDHCILAASSGKPAGASDSLACAPNDSARPLGLPITGTESHPVGYAFWTDGGSLSANASDSGAPLKVTATQPISVVDLDAPGQGINGTWIPRSGEKATLSIKSERELEALAEKRVAALRRR